MPETALAGVPLPWIETMEPELTKDELILMMAAELCKAVKQGIDDEWKQRVREIMRMAEGTRLTVNEQIAPNRTWELTGFGE
jgi:hypothetical protein